MLKTFIAGIVLGIAAAAGVLQAYPVVDQQRVASIVSVAANGGNAESFHVNVPMDRIMVGSSERANPLPVGLEWPVDDVLSDTRVELFKIRNARDIVVGVAARTAASDASPAVVDWVLHIPARGSLYVTMDATPLDSGLRRGQLRAGSREFAGLSGFVTERWLADSTAETEGPAGRIELQAKNIGKFEEPDEEESP